MVKKKFVSFKVKLLSEELELFFELIWMFFEEEVDCLLLFGEDF